MKNPALFISAFVFLIQSELATAQPIPITQQDNTDRAASRVITGLARAEVVEPVRMPELRPMYSAALSHQYTTSVQIAKCPNQGRINPAKCVTVIRNLE
jgi:hypothetical protein